MHLKPGSCVRYYSYAAHYYNAELLRGSSFAVSEETPNES